ncbi:hypothetical protein [Dyella subtropica]|uniref:hypothetical protein n=1 Tax=Dyella subtropica TaxID=2992127 RepID=UPI002253AF50|nr:hypothetical protein [Dyella subtropica]
MVRLFATAMVVCVLAGCATTDKSYSKIDTNAITSFKPGETTRAQAEAALGQPFQTAHMPNGMELLQYVTKERDLTVDDTPTTGSTIPKHADKITFTMLTFDKSGHFIRWWSGTKHPDEKEWPSDLRGLQSSDVQWTPTSVPAH